MRNKHACKDKERPAETSFVGCLLCTLLTVLVGCSDNKNHITTPDPVVVSGTVKTSSGQPLEAATVYLVPAGNIDSSTILNAQVLDGEAEAYDEPLEDLPAEAASTTTTDANGSFSFSDVVDGDYFLWAKPAAGDSEYLPGGAQCRKTATLSALADGSQIVLSSSPPATAVYRGTTTCLVCHPEKANHKRTAHANSIRVPGSSTSLQDLTRYADVDAALDFFVSTDSYTNGTELFYEDYDASRDADRFKVFAGATGGGAVHFRAYLWRDNTSDEYKITLVNESNPADTKELSVHLTVGGALGKQRFLVQVPGLSGHYPFLQYQHEGRAEHYDRTRRPWLDYHADHFWDDTASAFVNPPAGETFEGNCAACHFNGFTTWQDGTTSEWLADGVVDVNGIDVDGDLDKEEINVGCERCHGPGSEHVLADAARYIVHPGKLTPNRANLICGQCHERVQGKGTVQNGQPLDAADTVMTPGIRRSDFLASHTSRKTASAGDLWDGMDALHSKDHHQQYTDFLKAKHSRNARQLVVCADCHTLHDNEIDHQLLYSTGPDSRLCQRCHALDVTDHMRDKIGTPMSGAVTTCVACHMPKTAKSGAGQYGYLLSEATGAASDEDSVYWQNDLSSHTFAVPSRFTAMGRTPGNAMPTPYNHACGLCHVSSQLRFYDPMDSETCGACHVETLQEWKQSGHSQAVTYVTETRVPPFRGMCFRCHIGQQFVQEEVAGAAPYSGSLPYSDPMSQTCTVCHYPHFASSLGSHQLRAVGQAMVPENSTYVKANNARLCIACHNSRTADPEDKATPSWSGTEWRLGGTPHAGNQSETFLGIGAVTSYSVHGFDETTVSDSHHATQNFIAPGNTATQMCVTCHMHADDKPANHAWDADADACALCHASDTNWSAWGGAATATLEKPARGDYDGDGTTESVEAEYHGLLDRLLGALTDGSGSGIGSGFGFTWLGGHPYWTLGTEESSPPDADAAKAAYNYVLFEHDAAAGVHNLAYAVQVLRKTWRMLGRKKTGDSTWEPPGNDWEDL